MIHSDKLATSECQGPRRGMRPRLGNRPGVAESSTGKHHCRKIQFRGRVRKTGSDFTGPGQATERAQLPQLDGIWARLGALTEQEGFEPRLGGGALSINLKLLLATIQTGEPLWTNADGA
jgi:hypothetical protein